MLMLRSDPVGEFLGKELTDFVNDKGIVHDLTCPYTPQQNGMAEREMCTAVESVRTMLLHMGGWEVLDLTVNKVVTSVEVIFYETLSLEVLPPSPVLAPPFPIANRPASAPVSATGDEGSLEASPAVLASGIAGGRQGAKLVDQDGNPSTTGEPVEQEAAVGVQSTGELPKSAGGEQLVKGSKQLTVDEEGELSAGEESTDSDMVEVPITKPELRRTRRAPRPPERLSFHACLPRAAFTAVYDEVDDDLLYDDAEEDEELPELDPNMHTDPEHRWDIATMTVKEALASWKGEAVKAAMEEEICSLVGMGTWELVERPRGVNIMKNRWVLMTKYRLNDIVEREKVRLVVKGFMQVCGVDYDETYSPVGSYVTLSIFLSIVAVLGLILMQLDMKNAFLQSKLDRVLYMYQPDYFDDGTGRVCKLLKSLYGLKQSPLLWYRALSGVLLGTGWKKCQVDEALYFKASENGLHQQGYADKLRTRFIDEEHSGRVPKTPVAVVGYAELTFDDEEAQEREEEYRQKLGSLQFAATTTRTDIAFACSKLGRGLTVRSDQHWREVDRCLTLARVWGCMVQFMVPEQQHGGKLAPKAHWGIHLGVSPESKGWEVLDLTDNKVVTSVKVIFYETLSLEVWKAKFGLASGQTQVDGNPLKIGEQQIGKPVKQEASAGVHSTGELSKSAEDLAIDEEGELSAREESTDSDVVEVLITKPELRRTGRTRRPPERLSFHACLPLAAFTAVYDEVDDDLLYDDAEEDEELPELDPDMHADPEHHWDIATMMVKEALASWKGKAVNVKIVGKIHS
ncbi:unnamed protein product [Closterium sp. NIES-53]